MSVGVDLSKAGHGELSNPTTAIMSAWTPSARSARRVHPSSEVPTISRLRLGDESRGPLTWIKSPGGQNPKMLESCWVCPSQRSGGGPSAAPTYERAQSATSGLRLLRRFERRPDGKPHRNAPRPIGCCGDVVYRRGGRRGEVIGSRRPLGQADLGAGRLSPPLRGPYSGSAGRSSDLAL